VVLRFARRVSLEIRRKMIESDAFHHCPVEIGGRDEMPHFSGWQSVSVGRYPLRAPARPKRRTIPTPGDDVILHMARAPKSQAKLKSKSKKGGGREENFRILSLSSQQWCRKHHGIRQDRSAEGAISETGRPEVLWFWRKTGH
jgi:hypothetical protein